MKKNILTAVVFIALSAYTPPGKIWKNDPAHSQLMFTAVHLGISDVSGTFNNFQATIIYNKPDLSDARIELVAKVASIDTRVKERDEHLLSADFLDAAKFPEISFKSTGIKPTGKNKFKLIGNLNLHGVTRTAVLNLLYRGTTQNPINKKQSMGYQLTGNISRKQFSIGDKFPGPLLSDSISIKADGEFQMD